MSNPFSALLVACGELLAGIDEPMAQDFVGLVADAATVATAEAGASYPLAGIEIATRFAGAETRRAAAELVAASPATPWVQPDRAVVAPGWGDRAATAEIIGADGLIAARNNERFGILILDAGITYPSHWHNAEEFYLVVAGGGAWTIDGVTTTLRAGDYSRTPSLASHSIVTGDMPVVTIYGWSGDTSYDSYGF